MMPSWLERAWDAALEEDQERTAARPKSWQQLLKGFRLPKRGCWSLEMPRFKNPLDVPAPLTWKFGGLLGSFLWMIVPRKWLWALFATGVLMYQNVQDNHTMPRTSIYNAADFPGATIEAQITNAIAAAALHGVLIVNIPARNNLGVPMLPYNANLVTFNNAVRMIAEGLNPAVCHIDAYGAAGDGVTDDTTVIKTAISGAAGKVPVVGTPGKVYSIGNGYAGLNTTADAAKLLGIVGDNAILDFTGCTLKYGGAANDTNGSDNQGQTLVAFLGNNGVFRGTIDCNNKFRWGLGLWDIKSGLRFDCTILNAREPGFWASLLYVESIDVTGAAVVNRALNVGGFLKRPSCPFIDNLDAINGHFDMGAVIIPGSTAFGNTTSIALVMGDPTHGAKNAVMTIRTDIRGIPQFMFPGDANLHFADLACHDLGCDVIEGSGITAAGGTSYGMNGVDTLGFVAKNGSAHIYGHGNLGSDASKPSLVEICRVAGQAEVDFDYDAGGASGGRMIHKQTAPTEAVLVSGIDCRNQDQLFITITAARLVGVPLNPRKGQRLAFKFKQGGAGGFAITWNAIFTGLTWSDAGNATNTVSTIDMLYDGTNWSPISPQVPYHT